MAEQTTEHTEHDETTEIPEADPEKGEGTGGDHSESTPSGDTTDAAETAEEGGQDSDGAEGGEDWQAKAQLYKVHMRRNEKDLKAARAEIKRLEEEQVKAQKEAGPTEEPAPKGKDGPSSQQEKEPETDPVGERMEQLAAELAQVRQLSEELRQKNAEDARAKLVAEVAADKGLNVAQASRLRGDTREELEVDADEVKELFGLNQKRSPSPAPKPKEKRPTRGGSSNPDQVDDRSREEILAAVLNKGRRTGK